MAGFCALFFKAAFLDNFIFALLIYFLVGFRAGILVLLERAYGYLAWALIWEASAPVVARKLLSSEVS